MLCKGVRADFALQVKEIKAATEAYGRNFEREARSILEAARQKRQEEDRDQKSQIDELYLRTRAAAAVIKERAEAEFRVQESLRVQYMAETEDMLARSQEELAEVVCKSEDVLRRAEARLKEIRADAHREELRKSSIQAEMHKIVQEAHAASCAAWAEINIVKGEVQSQCTQPIDDVLRVIASAQAVMRDIEAEQQDLVRTRSRGLELNAKAAMRHAVQAKQLRKHWIEWTLAANRYRHPDSISARRTVTRTCHASCAGGHAFSLTSTCAILLLLAPGRLLSHELDAGLKNRTRFRNISLQRLIQLPALRVCTDDSDPVQSHVIHQMQI